MTFGRFERQARPASQTPDRVSLVVDGEPVPPLMVDSPFPVDEEWQTAFRSLINKAAEVQRALVDAACRAALLTGTHGVLVDGNTIRITTEVPYGEVHYAPYQVPEVYQRQNEDGSITYTI